MSRRGGFGSCDVCGMPLLEMGGYCGLGMCPVCVTGEADSITETSGGCQDQDCDAHGETADYRHPTKSERADEAYAQFPALREEVANSGLGLSLMCHSDVHYSLRGKGGWIVNFYPTKCRIWTKRDQPGCPGFVPVKRGWSLSEAVRAFLEHIRSTNTQGDNQ